MSCLFQIRIDLGTMALFLDRKDVTLNDLNGIMRITDLFVDFKEIRLTKAQLGRKGSACGCRPTLRSG